MLFVNSTLKSNLSGLVTEIIKNLYDKVDENFKARIDYTPKFELGHYACPAAMELARVAKKSPRAIAEDIQKQLLESEYKALFDKVEIAGPGFLNVHLSLEAFSFLTSEDFRLKKRFDLIFTSKAEPRILFEFVSANPTGPLNIVSARAAANGDVICRILERGGYDVDREYYVNDYGNQVKNLGRSFGYRYLQYRGLDIALPEDCYQGEYIKDVLEEVLRMDHPAFLAEIDPETLQDNETELNAFIEKASEFFAPAAIEALLDTQQRDLRDFRVEFDRFFRESNLHEEGDVKSIQDKLSATGHTYEKDGAIFFASSEFGDDKDRVIVRADGRPTYLLADIAYHYDKVKRGYHQIYDIWGPDHHGYIARLTGALKALGFPDSSQKNNDFSVLIVQQVNLIEDGKPIVMSKRLGQFHTMRDLIEKIPVDASRYFFIMRAMSTHLDFDLELALTQSSKNPVYYIQYAHARICSIFRESRRDPDAFERIEESSLNHLRSNLREELLCFILRYPELIEDICENHEVHRMATYLHELASLFTKFYHEDENRILAKLESQPAEAEVLLTLCRMTQVVLEEGLGLLGISAPREM